MAEFFNDQFSGTDGDLLTTYNPAWLKSASYPSGGMTLTAGMVRHSTTSTAAAYYFSGVAAPSADYSVQAYITLNAAISTAAQGVAGRMKGTTANFYWARINSAGITLIRYIGNTATTLATAPYTYVVGTTYKLRLEMIGSQISVYLDDVQMVSVTDSEITGADYVGIRSINGSNVLSLDNLTAFAVSAGGSVEYVFVGTGGVVLSGESLSTKGALRGATGGVLVQGAASISGGAGVKQLVVNAVGGIFLRGSGMLQKAVQRLSSGGLKLGGNSPVSRGGEGVMALVGAFGDVIKQRLNLLGWMGARNDMLRENEYWRGLGETADILSLNDVKKKVLRGQGHEGALNDMEKKWWSE